MRPAGRRDPQQLGRGDVRLRCEHHAERREHDVERPVVEREVLGVGGNELDRQSVGGCPVAGATEQLVDVVRRRDEASSPRRRERGIAVPGGDVEDQFTGANVDGLGQRLAGGLERGTDRRVVARRPRALLARLHGGHVQRGGTDGGHQRLLTPPVGRRTRGRCRRGHGTPGRTRRPRPRCRRARCPARRAGATTSRARRGRRTRRRRGRGRRGTR